jgi:hypothetical protein
MRANSQEHVERCEAATTPASQCRCRCGGRCHGRRLVAGGGGREAFEALPADDPHHLLSAEERGAVAREKRDRDHAWELARRRREFIEEVRERDPERAAGFEARWFTAAV